MEQKTEKHEIQMLRCGRGLRADENWMSAETSWVHDVAGGQKDMAGDQCAKLCKFKKLMVTGGLCC